MAHTEDVMGKNVSRKRWIKFAVFAVGVADCAGIYYASHRLDNSVPDDVRFDRTAYSIPEASNQFHAGDAVMFADGAAASTASAPALASAGKAAFAPKLAAAALVTAASVARASATAPVAAPEGPRSSAVSRMLAALQPAVKEAPIAPVRASQAPVVTPHLARVERPAAVFHGARMLTDARATAGFTGAASAKPAAGTAPASPRRSATSLAGLVPKARTHSEFTAAFASLDAPIQASQQLEHGLPVLADSAGDRGFASASAPQLENVVPAPAAELPAFSASAEDPAAKL